MIIAALLFSNLRELDSYYNSTVFPYWKRPFVQRFINRYSKTLLNLVENGTSRISYMDSNYELLSPYIIYVNKVENIVCIIIIDKDQEEISILRILDNIITNHDSRGIISKNITNGKIVPTKIDDLVFGTNHSKDGSKDFEHKSARLNRCCNIF